MLRWVLSEGYGCDLRIQVARAGGYCLTQRWASSGSSGKREVTADRWRMGVDAAGTLSAPDSWEMPYIRSRIGQPWIYTDAIVSSGIACLLSKSVISL
jgi:hypothetical protein